MAFSQLSANKFRAEDIHTQDSRKTVRFVLEAKATCFWLGAGGESKECKGATRDLSQRGAYVLAAIGPPSGALLRMVFSLPQLAGEARALRIEAEGRVLRIERLGQGLVGFAVSNHRFILCSL